MNISSVVIQVKVENYDKLKEMLEAKNLCQYHFGDRDNGKMVFTIEALSVEDEIKKFMAIQNHKYVLTLDMIQTYQEDISKDMDIVEANDDVPLVLSDDSIEIENIRYNGNLKNYF